MTTSGSRWIGTKVLFEVLVDLIDRHDVHGRADTRARNWHEPQLTTPLTGAGTTSIRRRCVPLYWCRLSARG